MTAAGLRDGRAARGSLNRNRGRAGLPPAPGERRIDCFHPSGPGIQQPCRRSYCLHPCPQALPLDQLGVGHPLGLRHRREGHVPRATVWRPDDRKGHPPAGDDNSSHVPVARPVPSALFGQRLSGSPDRSKLRPRHVQVLGRDVRNLLRRRHHLTSMTSLADKLQVSQSRAGSVPRQGDATGNARFRARPSACRPDRFWITPAAFPPWLMRMASFAAQSATSR